jgi:hypothetical protein
MRRVAASTLSFVVLVGCGGGHDRASTAVPPRPSLTASSKDSSTTASFASDADLLRLLPSSCRRQLLDPTIPPATRRKMRQRFLDDVRAAPKASRRCGEISVELSPTGK